MAARRPVKISFFANTPYLHPAKKTTHMKNKHLVFLFFATLVVGILVRQAPWKSARIFQTGLIRIDTAEVTQITLLLPPSTIDAKMADAELAIERNEGGWAATQGIRSSVAPLKQVSAMLEALSLVQSVRIVKTSLPDTLGLGITERLRVLVFHDSEQIEMFEIGRQVTEDGRPATYIRLVDHSGIYLVHGALRSIFLKNLNDFRETAIIDFDPNTVTGIRVKCRGDSALMVYSLHKNDTTGFWNSPELSLTDIPDDSIQMRLQRLSLLNGSTFADNFDESRERETSWAQIALYLNPTDSILLRAFYMKPPDLPDEISMLKAGGLPLYVVHSSQNPYNYFAPADTLLLRRLFLEMMPQPTGNRPETTQPPAHDH